MQMIFCVVLIIAAVCIAALVCYVVSGKVLQEKSKKEIPRKPFLQERANAGTKKP